MAGLHLDGRGVSVLWIALTLDLFDALLRAGGTSSGQTARAGFLLAGALTAAVSVYGFVAATRLRIERIVLASPKLPAGDRPLRIALISDVHLGALIVHAGYGQSSRSCVSSMRMCCCRPATWSMARPTVSTAWHRCWRHCNRASASSRSPAITNTSSVSNVRWPSTSAPVQDAARDRG